MRTKYLATMYTLFAALSTAANLLTQKLVSTMLGDAAFWIGMLAGTGVGLLVKYVLDKKWIFGHSGTSLSRETRSFILYSLAGCVTTVIFWGFELSFHVAFQAESMRYLGGAIGLAVGYVVKYHIDRRGAFRGGGEPDAG